MTSEHGSTHTCKEEIVLSIEQQWKAGTPVNWLDVESKVSVYGSEWAEEHVVQFTNGGLTKATHYHFGFDLQEVPEESIWVVLHVGTSDDDLGWFYGAMLNENTWDVRDWLKLENFQPVRKKHHQQQRKVQWHHLIYTETSTELKHTARHTRIRSETSKKDTC